MYLSLTAPVDFRIDGDTVYIETASGRDEVALSMPFSKFKQAIAGGAQAIAEHERAHGVFKLPRRPQHLRVTPLGVDD